MTTEVATKKHTAFVTTTRGLNRQLPPMKLFEKAKKYGIWNPSELDMTQDRQDWLRLKPDEQRILTHLTAQFVAGEEAVTLDLLPLILAIASENRTEEEMFLTTFLWEEAKHTDFFQRVLHEVIGVDSQADLPRFHTPHYSQVFYEALPAALDRLMQDRSPHAQLIASITYNMIVEGVLAETGYHAYFTMLKRHQLMPGVVAGVNKIKQDESRHIAYGIFLISRLVAENPALWPVAEDTMNTLLLPAVGIIQENFAQYDPMPFGLDLDEFIQYAMMQFQKRMNRIEGARGASLESIYQVTHAAIDSDDA
ncbi:MAG: R2-like ligand-binding oxidase [Anaerolineae bacterium]|nr:R2-like ligand-binding oxidase [Anaerolineae bacterium]